MPIIAPARVARTIHGGSIQGGWTNYGTLTTALTGANNDLVYTGKLGASDNATTIRYVNGGASQALSVSVVGQAITVNLATDGSSVITSTAAQVRTAVLASAPALALVGVANAAGNDGTGLVTALTATALTGGTSVSVGGSAGGFSTRTPHPARDS